MVVENKIDPGQPLDKDIYDLGPEELAKVPSMPGSLEEALDALEKDHAFLLKGDVFTEELSAPMLTTSARRKWMPSVCVRIPTSSRCITTFSRISCGKARDIPGPMAQNKSPAFLAGLFL